MERRLLVHLRARERIVGEDRDVELAALETGPLAAALLGGVGLAGFNALSEAVRDGLLVDANDHDAEVGQRLGEVGDPLEGDRLGDDDHRAPRAATLPSQRERGEDGERLADADVEAEPTAAVGIEAPRAGGLVRIEDDRGVPPRELERLGAVAVGAIALARALVMVLDRALAFWIGVEPGPEALRPVLRELQAHVVDLLVLPDRGLERPRSHG